MTRQHVGSRVMQALPRHAARGTATTTPLKSRLQFVCPSCQRRRAFSSTATRQAPAPPPPHPPRSGYARLTSRRLLSIGGVDAARFLQGIITSNIANNVSSDDQGSGGGFYSGLLNATGRVLHDVFIYPDTLRVGVAADDPTLDASGGQAFIIEVDAPQLGALTRHLRRYMLRSKLKVRALDEDECVAWHVWDDGSDSGASATLSLLPPTNNQEEGSTIVLRDDRAPGLGYRVLSKPGRPESGPGLPAAIADRLAQSDDAAYRVRRYLLGVAEGQDEILHGSALPLESNMDLMGAIDFRKGCYVGQELTIRTKHRGVVRKRILPCVLYGASDAAPPERLEYKPAGDGVVPPLVAAAEDIPADLSIGRDGKRGRSAGNWLRGVGNIGLALCRLQIMTDVQLPGETATAPFDPKDEFVMRWGEGEREREEGEGEGGGGGSGGKSVKVKAFVPEWLRSRLDESSDPQH